MVTILPFEIDEDLVRSGLANAAAQRVQESVRAVSEMAAELASVGIIDRAKWDRAFGELATAHATMEPVLEYARCFDDQWPEDENGDEAP